jgi:prevent-host-death family protein
MMESTKESDMRQFTTGDLNKQAGDVTDAAAREPIVLTKHRKPRFVLMSYAPRFDPHHSGYSAG